MNKIYGIALIGCGSMGAAHMDDIYFKENVSVKCVCDLNINAARSFSKLYNAERVETDFRKCVESDDVDIVIIATYPSTHLEIVKECLKNGKHVICEKPLTSTLDEAEEFVDLIKSHPDVKVLIGYILRHNKTYNRVAEMIRNGAIGRPFIIRMAQNHHTMNWGKYLRLIKETSPIIDCGVHYIDVMQWFSGAKITHVSGIGLKTEADVPDKKYNYGLITAKLSDGSIGYYEAGWGNTISSGNIKEFTGPRGRIRIIYEKDRAEHSEEGDLIEYYKYPEKTYELINLKCKRKPTGTQLDCLIDMIEHNMPANPTIDEVFESFKIAVEADKKIKGEIY